jgi:phosphatidylinositol alpha-1,6-mannosyltransferase
VKRNIFYLGTDVISTGGIQTYSRYQIKSLASSASVYVFNLVDAHAGDNIIKDINFQVRGWKLNKIGRVSRIAKFKFVLILFWQLFRVKPSIIFCNHISLAPILYTLQRVFKFQYVLNVYGLEIWSGISAVERRSLESANVVVADCQHICTYISENFNVDSKQLKIIYDPVDVEIYKPLRIDKAELLARYGLTNGFYILTVGRLARNKGHKAVIKALTSLPHDVRYLIAGQGPMLDELLTLAEKEKVSDRVFFLGRVENHELPYLYNVCDVHILLSVMDKNEGEGLPLTPIEAAACGAPIIVGNEDGSIEAVQADGQNGVVINPSSDDELVKAVSSIYQNHHLQIALGEMGVKFVSDNFSVEIFELRHHQLLEKLSKI